MARKTNIHKTLLISAFLLIFAARSIAPQKMEVKIQHILFLKNMN